MRQKASVIKMIKKRRLAEILSAVINIFILSVFASPSFTRPVMSSQDPIGQITRKRIDL